MSDGSLGRMEAIQENQVLSRRRKRGASSRPILGDPSAQDANLGSLGPEPSEHP